MEVPLFVKGDGAGPVVSFVIDGEGEQRKAVLQLLRAGGRKPFPAKTAAQANFPLKNVVLYQIAVKSALDPDRSRRAQ